MLKLEYLPDGSDDCPLIRLYGFDAGDVVALRRLCLALAEGRVREASLDSQRWAHAIGGCRLTLRAGAANRGVKTPVAGSPFVMEYAREGEGWLEVADKLAPFVADRPGGFQWLTDEGDVKVLISWSGLW
ncbi:MAG: hypothetical protein ACF8R7_13075 [Phycisphaerales bacterium JB039]